MDNKKITEETVATENSEPKTETVVPDEIKNEPTFVPTTLPVPSGELASMYMTRLGIILSNFAIVFAVLSFLTILGFILVIFFYLFLILFTILTLFTILANPEFREMFSGGGRITEIMSALAAVTPVFMGLSVVCSIGAIIFLSLDKRKRHLGRIIFSSISLGLTLIAIFVTVAFAIGGNS